MLHNINMMCCHENNYLIQKSYTNYFRNHHDSYFNRP